MYPKPCDLVAHVILKKAPIIISRASTLETAMGNKTFGSERPATQSTTSMQGRARKVGRKTSHTEQPQDILTLHARLQTGRSTGDHARYVSSYRKSRQILARRKKIFHLQASQKRQIDLRKMSLSIAFCVPQLRCLQLAVELVDTEFQNRQNKFKQGNPVSFTGHFFSLTFGLGVIMLVFQCNGTPMLKMKVYIFLRENQKCSITDPAEVS